ncbi:hypothetical protein BDQ17DRAFT_1426350 [Cyathus striatus]|nr:hypothetical protein BDQ17DRAFT_1426350 [Cyathus striatus]
MDIRLFILPTPVPSRPSTRNGDYDVCAFPCIYHLRRLPATSTLRRRNGLYPQQVTMPQYYSLPSSFSISNASPTYPIGLNRALSPATPLAGSYVPSDTSDHGQRSLPSASTTAFPTQPVQKPSFMQEDIQVHLQPSNWWPFNAFPSGHRHLHLLPRTWNNLNYGPYSPVQHVAEALSPVDDKLRTGRSPASASIAVLSAQNVDVEEPSYAAAVLRRIPARGAAGGH